MSSLPDDVQRSFTTEEVDAWLLAAYKQRARLRLQAALSPWDSEQRQEVLTAMSDLLLEAFEEVRVVSESTRERSQGVRGDASDLRTRAAQLMERGVTLMARMAQLAPPPSEETRETESQMLTILRGEEPGQRLK